VISKDHELGLGERRIEIVTCEAMRMVLTGLQRHQVDHIHHSDLEIGKMAAKDVHGGDRLQRRHVPGAGYDHVWFGITVVAGPLPDADAGATVFNGLIDR
jgi:hypothetical protein